MAEENTAEAVAEAQGAVALNVQDLAAVVQVIDIAVQRGAYRAPEMSQVGAVYDRVSNFVAQVRAQQAATAAAEATTDEAAADDGAAE